MITKRVDVQTKTIAAERKAFDNRWGSSSAAARSASAPPQANACVVIMDGGNPINTTLDPSWKVNVDSEAVGTFVRVRCGSYIMISF